MAPQENVQPKSEVSVVISQDNVPPESKVSIMAPQENVQPKSEVSTVVPEEDVQPKSEVSTVASQENIVGVDAIGSKKNGRTWGLKKINQKSLKWNQVLRITKT